MKRIIMVILLIVLGIGAVYGMKAYTSSYEKNLSGVITDNNDTDISKELDKNEDKEENSETDDKDNNEKSEVSEDKDNENEKGQLAEYNQSTNFSLVDLEGNEVSLSDYQGKKVFLNFWATWCPPCRGEMPDMNQLNSELDESEIVILAVNIGEDSETVKSFIERYNFNFKVLLDTDNNVAAKYSVSAIPTSYFIDENGNPLKKVTGAMTIEQMKDFIK